MRRENTRSEITRNIGKSWKFQSSYTKSTPPRKIIRPKFPKFCKIANTVIILHEIDAIGKHGTISTFGREVEIPRFLRMRNGKVVKTEENVSQLMKYSSVLGNWSIRIE